VDASCVCWLHTLQQLRLIHRAKRTPLLALLAFTITMIYDLSVTPKNGHLIPLLDTSPLHVLDITTFVSYSLCTLVVV
jgi:hypothetical protein